MKKKAQKILYNYDLLKQKIEERYGTRKAFAEALGIAENTLSLKMNHVLCFTQDEITRIRNLLELSPTDMAYTFLISANESKMYFSKRQQGEAEPEIIAKEGQP